MPNIVNSSNFNPASLQADDLYIRIVPPPGFVQGEPTDVIAIAGTASWGFLNQPQLLGSPSDLQLRYGGITADALTDVFDLSTDAMIAFMQAQSPASMQILGLRVSDGTDAKATFTLQDTAGTPASGLPVTALCSGKLGNLIDIIIAKGSKTNTWNVTIIPFNGARPEQFPNIVGGAGANNVFWANLKIALNSGISGVRGPSELVTGGTASSTAMEPAEGKFTLTGGTDGRTSVNAASLIGSDSSTPKTGMYAFRSQTPAPNLLILSGNNDTTTYATVQAFVESEGMLGVVCLAQGASSSAAVTTKKTLGIDSPNIVFVKDWIDFFDSINSRVRRVPPTAFIGGRIAALRPDLSPSNKEVYGVVGTERQNAQSGDQPYSLSEVGLLESNGIMFITNPVPGGHYWGMRHGRNSSSNGVTSPVEYGRMINFLSHSFASFLGKFIGQNQSQDPKDATRGAVKMTIDQFLEQLKVLGMIDSYLVVCDLSNNSFASIAQHYLYCDVKVRFMSSIYFFVLSLQGGTTVVTVGNNLGEGLQG